MKEHFKILEEALSLTELEVCSKVMILYQASNRCHLLDNTLRLLLTEMEQVSLLMSIQTGSWLAETIFKQPQARVIKVLLAIILLQI